jgi:nucleoid-associated protein YgaU
VTEATTELEQTAILITAGEKTQPAQNEIKEDPTKVVKDEVAVSETAQVEDTASSGYYTSMAAEEAVTEEAIKQDDKTEEAITQTESASIEEPKEEVVVSVQPSGPVVDAAPAEGKAPVVMIADNDGVRVVQSDTEKAETDVALDTISYDDEGDVALAGRGEPSGFVRIYLDNTPISTAAMDSTGQWNTGLSEIDPGIYTLRVDQLDPSGQVNSRLETPFKRESVETLQAQLLALEEPARINVVTVQPGNTLWAIARERYGLGMLYVRVFEANSDKIRDVDLIYPGQIFTLPD